MNTLTHVSEDGAPTMVDVGNKAVTARSAVAESRVRLVHGDTALSPYSTGTWGSRCAVMSGKRASSSAIRRSSSRRSASSWASASARV